MNCQKLSPQVLEQKGIRSYFASLVPVSFVLLTGKESGHTGKHFTQVDFPHQLHFSNGLENKYEAPQFGHLPIISTLKNRMFFFQIS